METLFLPYLSHTICCSVLLLLLTAHCWHTSAQQHHQRNESGKRHTCQANSSCMQLHLNAMMFQVDTVRTNKEAEHRIIEFFRSFCRPWFPSNTSTHQTAPAPGS